MDKRIARLIPWHKATKKKIKGKPKIKAREVPIKIAIAELKLTPLLVKAHSELTLLGLM